MNKQQRGYTLVELMISLLLGLMLISGFGSLFSQTQKNGTVQRSLSYMMEDGRYVLEIFGKELRRTGFLRNRAQITNVDGNGGPDLVFIRHPFDPLAVDPDTDPAVLGSAIDLLKGEYIRGVNNATPFGAGLVLRYQLNDRTELAFNEPSSDNSPCTRDIHLEAAEVTAEGVTPKKPETIRHVVTLYFYVALDASNVPVLYCIAKRRNWDDPDNSLGYNKPSILTPLPLISNVQQLLITYGIDDPAVLDDPDPLGDTTDSKTDVANYYVDAASVPDWKRVVSAKLSVVLRSEDDNLTTSPVTYTVDGDPNSPYTAADKRLYRVYSTTIAFRN